MLERTALLKTDEGWQFASEKDLEDFVWQNIETLFGLAPLKRQFSVKGEVCDILAISETKQLAILELKNIEDRYVVQQLTRYYDNLLKEKPFSTEVDYQQPIRLIAVKPSFHRHNEIDRNYHQLKFEFWRFEIVHKQRQLYFNLKEVEQHLSYQLAIPYPEEYISQVVEINTNFIRIPKIPKSLQTRLEDFFPTIKDRVLEIREKILKFDEQMGEVSTTVTTRYGLKKNEQDIFKSLLCAEFYCEALNRGRENEFHLFHFSLWLPFPKGRLAFYRTYSPANKGIFKLKINTRDLETASHIIVCRNEKPNANNSEMYNISQYLTLYKQITGNEAELNFVDNLIYIALSEWLERKRYKFNVNKEEE